MDNIPHCFTSVEAASGCIFLASAFVGTLYLLPEGRLTRTISRNHPRVILARFKSVALVCVLGPAVVHGMFWLKAPSFREAGLRSQMALLARWMGLYPVNITSTVRSLLLSGTLYLGPIVADAWDYMDGLPLNYDFTGLRAIRDYIVGPAAEEFVFRACMVPLALGAGWTTTATIFCVPLVFGVAHAHHMWERYTQNGRTLDALKQSVLVSTFQFCYTTMFGWYSTFLFIRTGSVLAPVASHMFCNVMGLPDFGRLTVRTWKDRAILGSFFAGLGSLVYLWLPLTE
ncbi:Abi-domain-containing protein [Gonapodya prolifera JEL478]|uniref:intramembrane prenyl-peptidase Rce1 n=1 Tax=Gonapodya prolifera (strain JEL478) TaxID=1344416 RepID=A0A139AF98_GONPJ|nr:Abi-domain-containing protein [Gonapodya prolifera JEL478]|eukprot:KXS15486.1 Abi-domain-containing protein [Gonapodya prolifera JEL478]